jgi:hypothetical protein
MEWHFVTHTVYPQYAMPFHLIDHGLLRYPADEGTKRLTTVVWMN